MERCNNIRRAAYIVVTRAAYHEACTEVAAEALAAVASKRAASRLEHQPAVVAPPVQPETRQPQQLNASTPRVFLRLSSAGEVAAASGSAKAAAADADASSVGSVAAPPVAASLACTRVRADGYAAEVLFDELTDPLLTPALLIVVHPLLIVVHPLRRPTSSTGG